MYECSPDYSPLVRPEGLNLKTQSPSSAMSMRLLACADDPIFNIGRGPVACGISDASENLDKYLYGGE
jgi:hypothetical protein